MPTPLELLARPAVLDAAGSAPASIRPTACRSSPSTDWLADRSTRAWRSCSCLPPADDRRREAATSPLRAPSLPGRHGHGADPVALLQRLYPADHPVLGAELATPRSARCATPQTLARGTAPAARPGSRGSTWPAPSAWPGSSHRLRQPDGCPWDREQDHLHAAALPARGDLRGLRRAGGRFDARAGRGAGRPVAADRAARAVRGRGRRLRPVRRAARP